MWDVRHLGYCEIEERKWERGRKKVKERERQSRRGREKDAEKERHQTRLRARSRAKQNDSERERRKRDEDRAVEREPERETWRERERERDLHTRGTILGPQEDDPSLFYLSLSLGAPPLSLSHNYLCVSFSLSLSRALSLSLSLALSRSLSLSLALSRSLLLSLPLCFSLAHSSLSLFLWCPLLFVSPRHSYGSLSLDETRTHEAPFRVCRKMVRAQVQRGR